VTQPVTVTTAGAAEQAEEKAEPALAGVAAAIVAKDASLWGPDAADEAAKRLGWLDCVTVSRPLIDQVEQIRHRLTEAGVDHIVLAGMGGSSLAPEVIAGTYDVELTVLDTTDPGQVQAAVDTDLSRTAVVVSSKSGGTLETDSHRRIFEAAFTAAGIDPAERLVIVTDPGSPLHTTATEAGYTVVEADPNVGGRYSALTAFGLVPTGLAGVPIGELLDQAGAVAGALDGDTDNPGLDLGAAIGGLASAGRDKVVLAEAGSGIAGFGDWAEQLLAESTGKSGRGVLPVVVDGLQGDPGSAPGADRHIVALTGSPDDAAPADGTAVSGPLGAQFLVWEFATAVAGKVLEIDPFNQPNVQESKDNTSKVLDEAGDGDLPTSDPLLVVDAVEVRGADVPGLDAAGDLAGALSALLAAIPEHGYLAVMAYLDRFADAEASQVRRELAGRTDLAVTFGWGPRFLHSTGQFHKGGPAVGGFLQVTGDTPVDVEVPGRPFGLRKLQLAQALGDRQALTSRSRPLVHLHLTDRAAGIAQLLAAIRSVK
jgi:glucose-6-phosphate isomerase